MNGLEDALDQIIIEISKAVDRGTNIIILSDRGSYFDIVIESAEPREPHHFATLFGYGASAINPYMVNEIIRLQVQEGFIELDENRRIQFRICK